MPQLDIIIIFPQIFWFFTLFALFYSLLIHYILPKLLLVLKSRKFILINNTTEIISIIDKSKQQQQIITQFITQALATVNNNLNSKSNNNLNSKSNINSVVSTTTKEITLYYNKYIFNLINLRHKNFNYKK